MKVYVVLCKFERNEYLGASATLNGAKEILQEILDEQYEGIQISSFEERHDYTTLWAYIIDDVVYEIWEEVI